MEYESPSRYCTRNTNTGIEVSRYCSRNIKVIVGIEVSYEEYESSCWYRVTSLFSKEYKIS